jgi:tetratricopeptide (TPR) repeat protein
MRGRSRLALLALLTLPLSARALAQSAAEVQEMPALQELMAAALNEFSGAQQSRSIVQWDELVARLEALRRQAPLSPRAKDLLVQAYEYRARAYYGTGLQDKAAENIRALIQLQPQHALSKERVSPKVVDFFNNIKKDLVGFLAVQSKPAGAKVSLNGEFLSLTDFFPLEVLAGSYQVEITREGYRTETREVTIAPKATETLEVDLMRTLARFAFVTEPAGVEIWMDGELRGTSSGSLAPDQHEAARAAGLEPTRASARFELSNVTLGAHQLEFRRKCYETVKRVLEVPEPADFDAPPVKLQDSVGSLQLSSDPPGALIFLDGEAMGQTPRELERVCSGKHRLEVKHASGKFVQDFTIARNESLSLDCPIRPSLAFLGVVAASAAGERLVKEAEERLIQDLGGSKIKTLNFVPAPREALDRLLESERVTLKGLIPGPGNEPDTLRRVTEKLAAALEVQGFLIALLPEERLQRTAQLHLLAAGNTVSDSWPVTYAESASYLRFLSAVDQRATAYRPWSGLITVDTLLHDGVPVLRIVPGSPAAAAGIKVGEVLYAVDGQPVKRTVDLLRAIGTKKPGDRLALQLRAAAPRALELQLGVTPQEVPLNDSALLYNKVMMDLRQQVDGYPGTETAAFARFNLGICAMHFGDFAAAHEHFLKAKAEMPNRPGLSQGSAAYYLGVALERLGYKREAAEAYKGAAAFKEATLFNNDGPAVAPLAERRAGGGS